MNTRLSFTDPVTYKGIKIWESEHSDGVKSVGAFKLKNVSNDFYIYPTEDWENELWGHNCKSNEHLYRYETATSAIGGFKPLIKINMNNGLVYFLKDLYADEVSFNTKSDRPVWINLNTSEETI